MPGLWTPADRHRQLQRRDRAGCSGNCWDTSNVDCLYLSLFRRGRAYGGTVVHSHDVPGGVHLEPRQWSHRREFAVDLAAFEERPTVPSILTAAAFVVTQALTPESVSAPWPWEYLRE